MREKKNKLSFWAAAALLALAVLLVLSGQPSALASEAAPEPTAEATEECAEAAESDVCAIVVPLDIPAELTPEAAPAADPGINPGALYHDSRSDLYRTPGGAAPFGTTVTLRLRAAAGNLDSATVRVWNTREEAQSLLPMRVAATTPQGYDLWETTLDVGGKSTVLWYRFIVTRGNQTLYYEDDTRLNVGSPYLAHREGGAGMVYAESPDLSYQITVYDPAYYTPEWMRNAVVYQIFPDRFRDGDPSNNPADGDEVFYDALPLIFHDTWNEPPVDGRRVLAPAGDQGYYNSDFYGGDLAGITEKLDYLHDLGVTAIYLNPIFLARSNHRYDTVDYLQIDPILGTLEDFRTLVSQAEQRGIKIILDGVFNHLSSDSPYFDRFDRFEGQEGACESLKSPYRAWFYFAPPRANQPAPCAGDPDPLYYVSWAGFDTIPRVNNTIVETRRFFFLDENSVGQTWVREGIGGWRLDVAPDIDNGRDPNNIYWEMFRTVLRRLNPETVIIGEEWSDAAEFFGGDEWDSTMNYRLRAGILGFVRDTDFTDNDSNGDRVMYALPPSELDNTIRSIEEDYPQPAYHALMNVLSSHDVSRLFFVVGSDRQAHKLAALAQFALPGAPTIYYGDEIAIDAPSIRDSGGVYQDDPYNRAPYPWPDTEGDYYPPPDEDMLAFYRGLGALRRDNPALRTGEMVTLLADDQNGLYAFARLSKADGSAALVALNRSATDRQVRLDFGGLLPSGLRLQPFPDGAPISTDGGSAEVAVPARSGIIWTVTADAAAFEAPAAPDGLTTVARSGQVLLEWEAADGAAGYIVYRSPVASGGFEPLTETPVSGTTFADETVTNGFVYYYAVAAAGENGLVGDPGASIMAAPSYTIDETFYVGESAEDRELELVFGLNVPVQAAVKIDGVTEAAGQTPGILARAALVPAGGDLAADLPMVYAGDVDGADAYSVTIAPQAVGEYQVVVQFSADAGLTWTTVRRADGTLPLVTLAASGDTTPPEAPAEARIVRASLSGVALEWEAVVDENLFAYRVYRSADGEAAEMIAETAAESTAYTDSAVVEGKTYFYSVAAVDGALNESPLTSTEAVTVARLVVPVTFVAEVPDYTTGKVFIAGDFGGSGYPRWDPAGLEMTQADDTHWTITLEIKEGTAIEYKYVRGDWSAVEKGAECEEIANRRLTIRPDEAGEQQAADEVQKWRDLDACG
ncbi:MAG: hypothetical protein DWB42_11495 [Chloroflexi bacterium]|nr:hypothetical protein [Chloroflexota bacterium]MDL1884877.1 hypothetical protein [Anaerolineae bacterium CFX8]